MAQKISFRFLNSPAIIPALLALQGVFLLSKKALIVPLGYCEMGGKPAALWKDKSFITFLHVFKVPHKCCVGAESSAALAAGKQGCSTMAHSQLCCFRRHHLLLHITHFNTSLHLPPRIIYLHRVCSLFLCPGTSSFGKTRWHQWKLCSLNCSLRGLSAEIPLWPYGQYIYVQPLHRNDQL